MLCITNTDSYMLRNPSCLKASRSARILDAAPAPAPAPMPGPQPTTLPPEPRPAGAWRLLGAGDLPGSDQTDEVGVNILCFSRSKAEVCSKGERFWGLCGAPVALRCLHGLKPSGSTWNTGIATANSRAKSSRRPDVLVFCKFGVVGGRLSATLLYFFSWLEE